MTQMQTGRELTDKVAMVTGAGCGIGRAIALTLAAQGAKVAVLDINAEKAQETAGAIQQAGGTALAVSCDVGQVDSVSRAINQVEESLGLATILVNNAGVGGLFHRVDQVSDAEWDWIINTNLRSVFLFARDLLPKMAAQSYGRIVNIASVQGLLGAPRSSTYVASKHGMIGYTKAIAAEWGDKGITCNAICPGYIDAGMGVRPGMDDYMRQVMAKTPVKRVGTPEEIAALVLYLVGPMGGYTNGASFTVDGGISCHVGIYVENAEP